MQQKVDPYLRPLFDSLHSIFGIDRTNSLVDKGVIEVAPLAFMRGRTLENSLIILDDKNNEVAQYNVTYGANMHIQEGDKVKAGQLLIQWDPYTDIILARETGIVKLKDFVEGETFSVESVETGKKQIVVIESRDRKLSPHLEIVDKKGEIVAGSTILPVKATLVVNDKEEVNRGQTLVKIPKEVGKSRDITGGLPRVAELFESRKPTNPAVMTEINGTVKFGETIRGFRKIHVI